MPKSTTLVFITLLLIIACCTVLNELYALPSREAVLVNLDMSIDGGALSFFERSLSNAGGRVLVIRINSYGGYLSVADRIVNTILERNIECYVWIPPGGQAVSAAAMISLACNGIFMGSGSTIGDAIPVPADQKTVEYVAAKFRSLAQRLFRGNETLIEIAEDMVRKGRTLTDNEAVAIGFARRAETLSDVERELGLSIVAMYEPSSWDKIVSILSLPIVSEILLFAGILLVVVEVLTTGFQGYAIAGALLIAVALYAMNIITPDIFALVLILLGLVLLAIEMYTPGFGAFGISGIVLTIIGVAYQLYQTPSGLLTPPVYVVIAGFALIAGLMVFIAYKAVEASRLKKTTLEQQLLGSIGIAKTDVKETEPGVVYVLGEEWTSFSVKGVIPAGSKVRVVKVEGLKLYVERVEQ